MSSMSLTEILAEIPKLSFAERQELVRRAIEVEDQDLTAEEKAILEERLADFRRNPSSGTPGEQLKAEVLQRLNRRYSTGHLPLTGGGRCCRSRGVV
jgi:putative addiction module component (TIGR02574 family)